MRRVVIGILILILVVGVISLARINRTGDNGSSDNDSKKITQEQKNGKKTGDSDKDRQNGERNLSAQNFDRKGTIVSVSGNSFTIDGKIVTIDPAELSSGVVLVTPSEAVAVGNQVGVNGEARGEMFFAKEISLIEASKTK